MSISAFDATAVNPSLARLELTGVSTVFNAVSGFSISCDTQRYQQRSSTGQVQVLYRSGPATYGDLTCTANLSATDTSLFDWWTKTIGPAPVEPLEGTLMLMSPDGTPQASFTIVGAILTSLQIASQSMENPTAPTVTAVLSCESYARMS